MIKRSPNKTLEEQYIQQGECCYYCKTKVPFDMITRDHIKPASKGNVFINNKIYACRHCNNMKGNRTFEEFKNLLLKRSCYILKQVISQGWKISDLQLTMIRQYSQAIKTVDKIIENNNKTDIYFT